MLWTRVDDIIIVFWISRSVCKSDGGRSAEQGRVRQGDLPHACNQQLMRYCNNRYTADFYEFNILNLGIQGEIGVESKGILWKGNKYQVGRT